jgi:hypothetical protein
MPKAALADHHLEWFQLAAEVRINAAELVAGVQQLTRDMDAVKARARIVAGQVRAGVRTKYGYGNEKLTAFGMRPRRRSFDRLKEEQAGAALVAPALETPDEPAKAAPTEGKCRPSRGGGPALQGGDHPLQGGRCPSRAMIIPRRAMAVPHRASAAHFNSALQTCLTYPVIAG